MLWTGLPPIFAKLDEAPTMATDFGLKNASSVSVLMVMPASPPRASNLRRRTLE